MNRPRRPPHDTRVPRSRRRLPLALAGLLACVLAGGCATTHPAPITVAELAEAQTFPYFQVYWAGPRFGAYPLAAADGRKSYSAVIGDSVYYGDCAAGKSSALGSSGCQLPLQVTTVIYNTAFNASLGSHRNTVLRGVPATFYDGGNSIALYSARQTINVFSDSSAEALNAVQRLRPLNAPGAAATPLPAPVYCPVLSGPQPARLQHVMQHLPGRACQRAAADLETDVALFGKP